MPNKKEKPVEQVEVLPVLPDEINAVIIAENGKCDKLSLEQRAEYMNWLCKVAGVDPSLRPFDLIPTQNGLKPFANKTCAEIIRDARGISVTHLETTCVNGIYITSCTVADRSGRTDTDIGAWPMGNEPHNALMKSVTKAKRRATLSLARLGGLVEEAHPSEYNVNGAAITPCKSSLLLEDTAKAKNQFAEVCKMKTKENLTPELLGQLLVQVQKVTGLQDIVKCSDWVQFTSCEITVTETDGKKTAQFKEAK